MLAGSHLVTETYCEALFCCWKLARCQEFQLKLVQGKGISRTDGGQVRPHCVWAPGSSLRACPSAASGCREMVKAKHVSTGLLHDIYTCAQGGNWI